MSAWGRSGPFAKPSGNGRSLRTAAVPTAPDLRSVAVVMILQDCDRTALHRRPKFDAPQDAPQGAEPLAKAPAAQCPHQHCLHRRRRCDPTGCAGDSDGRSHVQRAGVQRTPATSMTERLKAIFRSLRARRPRHRQLAELLESSRWRRVSSHSRIALARAKAPA